ncbi:MAG: Holliday junction branch migration protein RuvA [Candidatus Pacebacteria bacterium]|nr:Holliday junction branch migration protein RuvA [Candidatus Paceibacterota bacterium]
MLAYIEEGIVIQISPKFIILNKNGIGYRVSVMEEILSSLNTGDILSLWIYTAVRENSIDLYGFSSSEEMAFFELLLEVSGIGPKSALATLGVAPIETLKKAIATGDTSYLNKVSGIGKKTAERIVIELRDKLISYKNEEGNSSLRDDGDVVEALKSLGYSQSEAREALKQVPKEIEGANARIKESLKILSNR